MTIVRLGDICQQSRESIKPGARPELRYIGLESIESGSGLFAEGELSKTPDAPMANSFRFGPEHVLYGKLRPYLNKVALADFEGKCSTEIIPLLPSQDIERAYLAYFLRSGHVVGLISARTAGARMPRADMDFIFSLPISLPPLPEQRRIVDLLSRAEGIVRLRREASRCAAELIPALFLDMFGDPATNPKGWAVEALDSVAQIISGATKGRRLDPEEGVELPYMRVANVKDGFLDLTEVKTIVVKRNEVEKYRLLPGDLLLTEGGDPDKLGRGALWAGAIETCLHQNHIFKVRADRTRLLPEYLCELVGSNYGKAYFLRVAKKTTGIATINRTQLGGFPVVIPSTECQQEFAERIGSVRSIQSQQSAATVKAQATFDALLANAFSPSGPT